MAIKSYSFVFTICTVIKYKKGRAVGCDSSQDDSGGLDLMVGKGTPSKEAVRARNGGQGM
jgi:hypothetical protein